MDRAREASLSLNTTASFVHEIVPGAVPGAIVGQVVRMISNTDIVADFPAVDGSYDVRSQRFDSRVMPPSGYWLQMIEPDRESLPPHVPDMIPGIQGVALGIHAAIVADGPKGVPNTQPLATRETTPLAVVSVLQHPLSRAVTGAGIFGGWAAESLESYALDKAPSTDATVSRGRAAIAGAELTLGILRTPAVDPSGNTQEWLAENTAKVRRACIAGEGFSFGSPPNGSMVAEAYAYDGPVAGRAVIINAVSATVRELGFPEEESAVRVIEVMDRIERKG
jgi:hypothetical protein